MLWFVASVFALQLVSAIHLQAGYDHHYTYSSDSDLLGLHNFTTIIKFHVGYVSSHEEGSLFQLMVDSYVQHSKAGYIADNPMKWNLSNRFYFTIAHDGLIAFVHHDGKDEQELVTLKKILAGTLVIKVKVQSLAFPTFSSEKETILFHGENTESNDCFSTTMETDHAGTLDYEYKCYKQKRGYLIERNHRSVSEAHRHHQKIVTLDMYGTPVHIDTVDNITFHRADTDQGSNNTYSSLKVGETKYTPGEFPLINSISTSKIELSAKRRVAKPLNADVTDMFKDFIVVTTRKTQTSNMSDIEHALKGNITCVERHVHEVSQNTINCVHNVQMLVSKLKETDFAKFANMSLEIVCSAEDMHCQQMRRFYIDVVLDGGSHLGQTIVLDKVLNNQNTTEDDLSHCFYHCASIDSPIKGFVEFAERICFANICTNESVSGSLHIVHMETIQRRACLAFGSMGKHIAAHDSAEANRIVEKLANVLQVHNETMTEFVVKPRLRRATSAADTIHTHVDTKTVLLHSLGNAGHNGSIGHLLTYTIPNVGLSVWRRAALNGLRHFQCSESARVLADAIRFDEDEHVISTAKELFDEHPKKKDHVGLFHFHSYNITERQKRGTREQSQSFSVDAPTYSWQKIAGSKNMGLGLSLGLKNDLKGNAEIQSTRFNIDVFENFKKEILVGIFNTKFALSKAQMCYKGHLKYDMNTLKDFDMMKTQKEVERYDRALSQTFNQIKSSVRMFKQSLTNFKGKDISSIFSALNATFEMIPTMFKQTRKTNKQLQSSIERSGMNAKFLKIKTITDSIKVFTEDVSSDSIDFYMECIELITTSLPYIQTRMINTFNSMNSGLKGLVESPREAIDRLSRSQSHFKMALTMLVDVKVKIENALTLMQGRNKYWLNMPKVLLRFSSSLSMAKRDLKIITAHLNLEADETTVYQNGLHFQRYTQTQLIPVIESDLDEVQKAIDDVAKITEPLLSDIDTFLEFVKNVKGAYVQATDSVYTGKSKIHKVFGPKFHHAFPKRRRTADVHCSPGIWPTTTDGLYETVGIDLQAKIGQQIVAPVDGILSTESSKRRVKIRPTMSDFKDLEILIENINPFSSLDNLRVASGITVGIVLSPGKCQHSFIHASVRDFTNNTSITDKMHGYIDPSRFIDNVIPKQEWVQQCDDYHATYMLQVIDSGRNGHNAKHKEIPLKRNINKNSFSTGFEPDIGNHIPTLNNGADINLAYTYAQRLEKKIEHLNNDFERNLFLDTGTSLPVVTDAFNKQEMTVENVANIVVDNNTVNTIKKMVTVLDNLFTLEINEPTHKLTTLPLRLQHDLVKIHGLPVITDGKAISKMDSLMFLSETKCSNFKTAIGRGYNRFCIPHSDCLGISCNIDLVSVLDFSTTGMYTMSIRLNQSTNMFDVSINEERYHVPLTADHASIAFNMGSHEQEGTLQFGLSRIENDQISLDLELDVCQKLMLTCHQTVDIFHGLRFKIGSRGTERTLLHVEIDKKTPLVVLIHGEPHEHIKPDFTSVALQRFDTLVSRYRRDFEPDQEHGKPDLDFDQFIHDGKQLLVTVAFQGLKKLFNKVPEEKKNYEKKFFGYHIDENPVEGRVTIPIPIKTFRPLRLVYPFGPIAFTVAYGFKISFEIGLGIDIQFQAETVKGIVSVRFIVKMFGEVGLWIPPLEGGLRLSGYIVDVKYTFFAMMYFSNLPMKTRQHHDISWTPFGIELSAFVDCHCIKRFTIIEKVIIGYHTPSYTWVIKDDGTEKDDDSEPHWNKGRVTSDLPHVGKRAIGQHTCYVRQIPNKKSSDTAFAIEMYADDDMSTVKLQYSIGTFSGGNNLIGWTDISGNTLLVPAKLPGGIPLYWTAKAINTQGLEAVAMCKLETFDNTLPDGRVEHDYKFSSHPHNLQASLVVIEDSPFADMQFKSVGYSPGRYGSEVTGWQNLRLSKSYERDVSGVMRFFSKPRKGKLVAFTLRSANFDDVQKCAQLCINFGVNCNSFDYEYHSRTCDLHDVIEGQNAELRVSGTYSNFERLSSGAHALLHYTDLNLTHGMVYFLNAKVTNALGYVGYLQGAGTMIDFTPPEPGLILNGVKDELQADKCTAAVTQRCEEVTWKNNHRIIEDGEGSETIFNGNIGAIDSLYTLTNHYITGNWKGFHDDESGIWGYTWAVGKTICGDDVISFENPYTHLTNSKFWTDSAMHKNIHLEDGRYFITVQALNGVELGGSLVTTVCHTTPFTVDTSSPIFSGVTDIIYDEDFDLIAVYYEGFDELSKIANAEFGLGKTKYDVQIKPYSLHASMIRDDPFMAIEELGLQEGIPAWIRVRITNNVDLFTSGHGEEPILIDRSPPIPGTVLDGDIMQKDRTFQADSDKICAQWVDFFDSESGIDKYIWGVGTSHLKDDVVAFTNLSRYEKSSCSAVTLHHNITYFSTVFAFNNALNSKDTNSTSDGVLVDLTPPVPGMVNDGEDSKHDVAFSSETVSKYANWHGYHDQESGIDQYKIDVFVNNELKLTNEIGIASTFEDHTVSMNHLDQVYFNVYGVNGAGVSRSSESDGFLVDHSPPQTITIQDSAGHSKFQSDNYFLRLKWQFADQESGISEYRTALIETTNGIDSKAWPVGRPSNKTLPKTPFVTSVSNIFDEIPLKDGSKYSLQVIALNQALLSTSRTSPGITIDTTPPSEPLVHIGHKTDDEEIDEGGNILHDDENGILITLTSVDSESGVDRFQVAVGTDADPESVLVFTDYFEDVIYISNIHIAPFSESDTLFVISVQAVNGAGLKSTVGTSKKIYVLKANVPGIVFDGRQRFVDQQYCRDKTSLAASFYGFESEKCNILRYEWAIGTFEYATDVMGFTKYGLVMLNMSYGQCQIHTELFEDTTYFITVRAITGCKDEYIVASSNGVTVDSVPPVVQFNINTIHNAVTDTMTVDQNGVLFQDNAEKVGVTETIIEAHQVAAIHWALSYLPNSNFSTSHADEFSLLKEKLSLTTGHTYFINARAIDASGNSKTSISPPLMPDISAPVIHNFSCTPSISYRNSTVTCTWDRVAEPDSLIGRMTISIGTTKPFNQVLNEYRISQNLLSFTRDLFDFINVNYTRLHVSLTVGNIVHQINTYGKDIIIDNTPPTCKKVNVVTSSDGIKRKHHQRCQQPSSYVEVMIIDDTDAESGTDPEKFQIAIGSKPFGSDLQPFTLPHLQSDGSFLVTSLKLSDGQTFYATARIYNKAGLFKDFSSDIVTTSLNPYLRVIDGPNEHDVNYVSKLNIAQGQWMYSDSCLISLAQWRVYNIIGDIVANLQYIPSAAQTFYNDELNLINGMKYVTEVRTVDALNRTRIAMSDGFTARIQPPLPGLVRDGKVSDINFQHSSTEISANWNQFGDETMNDPTQIIDHYEVAVGNDRRYAQTRSNVHYFVNVGLNRTVTFIHLNLTVKRVRYYVTVRAYSKAGSFIESTSNGMRVGFDEAMQQGKIVMKRYQSSGTELSFSWKGFFSDIGIERYLVGVSSHDQLITNDTIDCELFEQNSTAYDLTGLIDTDLDEHVAIKDLKLIHNFEYYATVIAKDASGMCISVTTPSILIDTTPPVVGDILINDVNNQEVMFATSSTDLRVSWRNFQDNESLIKEYIVKLYQCNSCVDGGNSLDNCNIVSTKSVGKVDEADFYNLQLESAFTYNVMLEVVNNAELTSTIQSPTILIDLTPPLDGKVVIGFDWKRPRLFQGSTSEINGLVAIAGNKDEYACPNGVSLLPGDTNLWDLAGTEYSEDYQRVNETGAYLGIGYNSDLTDLKSSGMLSTPFSLSNGNYTAKAKIAKGHKTITTIAFVSNINTVSLNIRNEPIETQEKDMVSYNQSMENVTRNTNNISMQYDYESNGTKASIPNVGHGFGIHLLGYRIANNTNWYHVFWARNAYMSTEKWVKEAANPSDQIITYTVSVHIDKSGLRPVLDLDLFINDKIVSNMNGFEFDFTESIDLQATLLTWTDDGYKPDVIDVYDPFYTETVVKSLSVPTNKEKPCIHGKGFFDEESAIKEIWIGLSSDKTNIGNLNSLTLYESYCFPCIYPCSNLCSDSCNASIAEESFHLVPLSLHNLTLETTNNKVCSNVTDENVCNSTYYLNVKIVNFAGLSTIGYSNPVQVDVTSPVCTYMKCLDPENSEDEPTNHLGSNSTVGAYWNCTEDVSEIEKYSVMIHDTNSSTIMNKTNVGLNKRARFKLQEGTFLNAHDYILSLEVMNTAGLSTIMQCNLHVNLMPPDISNTKSDPMFATSFLDVPAVANITTNEVLIPLWTSSQTKVGISWEGVSNETRFVEWEIGTEPDNVDLFPPSKVGFSAKGSVSIENGKLNIHGTNTSYDITGFGNTTTEAGSGGVNETSNMNKAFLMMEPGRCVYQRLYAVGFSHLKQRMQEKSICVRRANDCFVSTYTGRKTVNGSKQHGSAKWVPNNNSSATISIEAVLVKGGLSFGTITDADKAEIYGSAASSSYVPFISDPHITRNATSRLLRNRINSFCGQSFYISPAPIVEIEDMSVYVELDAAACNPTEDYQAGLVFWDKDAGYWTHIEEGCTIDITSKVDDNGTYIAKLCLPRFTNYTRSKRSITSSLSSPRAMELVLLSKAPVNRPPKITTSLIENDEDNFQAAVIEFIDHDGDDVIFTIEKQPTHGICAIDQNGVLTCDFETNFYGNDEITVKITETNIPFPGELFSDIRISQINIIPKSDITERYFIDQNNVIHRSKTPFLHFDFYVEANTTTRSYVGTILLADVDGNETFTEKIAFTPLQNASYSIIKGDDMTALNVLKRKSLYNRFRSVQTYVLEFQYLSTLNGNMDFKFIAATADGSHTPSVTIHAHVLVNPCVHGHCSSVHGSAECTDSRRALSFDGYLCTCDKGYAGQWCQDEINECLPEPCALMFDCEDLINNYRCNINIPKLMAILICSTIAIAGVVFLGRKLVRRYKHNKVSQSTITLQEPDDIIKTYAIEEDEATRPLTSGSVDIEERIDDPGDQPKTTNIWSVLDGCNADGVTANPLATAPGLTLPPHHRPFGTLGGAKRVLLPPIVNPNNMTNSGNQVVRKHDRCMSDPNTLDVRLSSNSRHFAGKPTFDKRRLCQVPNGVVDKDHLALDTNDAHAKTCNASGSMVFVGDGRLADIDC